ncbi:hypothetical protein TRFO_04984 [Tritrichomonas foetus]|uniref:EB1 C-terminal domain-containing protein n=1 Tax=Tritrichomonas foetus TaxID=1144522 RepID=A0A1J4KBJ8_9EUKA|nr:hypothetical protein TRFO_04984 [Tritrichomonas foetus]|eukprot:OHT08346.1 hypothetical protein TRFO_04984 [Tritrichomonas foetus]
MNTEKEIVNWFSYKTGSQIQTFREVQRGAEICIYLCDISDNPDLKNQIQPGSSYEERQSNYELAKSLIENLGLEFTYDIDKLSRLDKSEFIRFAQEIMSLEEDDVPIQYDDQNEDQNDDQIEDQQLEDDSQLRLHNQNRNQTRSYRQQQQYDDDEEEDEMINDFDFDGLFAELDEDLNQKLQNIHQFQEELDYYEVERDFYLSKLMQIEKACKKYSEDDYDAVIRVLQLSSSDFAPVDAEDSS